MMNKKGNTYIFWVEVIIFLGLFLLVMGIIGLDMNNKYGDDKDLTMGMNLSNNVDSLSEYKDTVTNGTSEGQASLTDFGVIKLLTIPSMIYQVTALLWNFVSGSFINTLVYNMNLGVYGTYIASFFRILYIIVIAFILIKLVLRINI